MKKCEEKYVSQTCVKRNFPRLLDVEKSCTIEVIVEKYEELIAFVTYLWA